MTNDELEFVQNILAAAKDYPGKLNNWENNFSADVSQRVEKYGLDTHCSPKQWESLRRIAEKVGVEE